MLASFLRKTPIFLFAIFFGVFVVFSVCVFSAQANVEVCTFEKDLYLGVHDLTVLCLQRFLNQKGFVVASAGPGSSGNETDFFGNMTKNAVILWQTENGIKATGYWGPISRSKYEFFAETDISPSPVSSSAPIPLLSVSPSSSPVVSSLLATPKILSASPEYLSDGDMITLYGSGFTPEGNFVKFSIDPPAFPGQNLSSDPTRSKITLLVNTHVKEKLQKQLSKFSSAAQAGIKAQIMTGMGKVQGIIQKGGLFYLPIDITVRNMLGISGKTRIFVNVLP